MTKFFTLEQANALLPTLRQSFERLLPIQVELRKAYVELEKIGMTDPELPNEPVELHGETRHIRGRFLALALALAEEYETIESTGVLVKDPETGLCDFPSIRGGRIVMLCWRLGEPAVTHWHYVDANERQPLQ